jgi:hypothetical protein
MTGHDARFRRTWVLLLMLLALANSGCLLVAAGAAGGAAAGYAYYQGRVGGTYNANFGDTWAATHQALAELGMPIVKEDRKASQGFVETRASDGDRVRIYVEAEPSRIPAEGQITHVSVRVATFGDHPLSNRILDQVNLHLAPASATPTAPAPPAVSLGPVVQTGASTAPPPLAVPPQPVPVGK